MDLSWYDFFLVFYPRIDKYLEKDCSAGAEVHFHFYAGDH